MLGGRRTRQCIAHGTMLTFCDGNSLTLPAWFWVSSVIFVLFSRTRVKAGFVQGAVSAVQGLPVPSLDGMGKVGGFAAAAVVLSAVQGLPVPSREPALRSVGFGLPRRGCTDTAVFWRPHLVLRGGAGSEGDACDVLPSALPVSGPTALEDPPRTHAFDGGVEPSESQSPEDDNDAALPAHGVGLGRLVTPSLSARHKRSACATGVESRHEIGTAASHSREGKMNAGKHSIALEKCITETARRPHNALRPEAEGERKSRSNSMKGMSIGGIEGRSGIRREPARISAILEQVIAACADGNLGGGEHEGEGGAGEGKGFGEGDSVSLSQVLSMLGPSAFPVLIFLLSIPSAVGVPGVSFFLGFMQGSLALQMIAGQEVPSFPAWLLRRPFKKKMVRGLLSCVLPAVRFLAKHSRPRWLLVQHPLVEHALAVFILQYSVIIMLPVPLSQQAPAACLALISLGIAELDGAMVVVGLFFAVLAGMLCAHALHRCHPASHITTFSVMSFGMRNAVLVCSGVSGCDGPGLPVM